MLFQFLEENRLEILALVEEKTLKLAGPLSSSEKLRQGLPIFLNYLVQFLKSSNLGASEKNILAAGAEHGKELLRLRYTMSHVVHSYGAMCQAITELAVRRNADISTQDFNDLNLCLDLAIASAVSEYQHTNIKDRERNELQHLGFLVHELRNSLSSAIVAHTMIADGVVGTNGSTSKVLRLNLERMGTIIDRSLSDLRMRTDPEIHVETFSLPLLVDQILITKKAKALKKHLDIKNTIDDSIEITTDRQLLHSAVSNLIQNAIKYSPKDSTITLRARSADSNIVIEIENEGPGLDPEIVDTLFEPFFSGSEDRTGLGLGLSIVKRAVEILQGKIEVHNYPGRGCAFVIDIPRVLVPRPINRPLSGIDAPSPSSSKKTKKH